MSSIPAAIHRIYGNNFNGHYLKNERLSLNFLLNSWIVHEIQSIFLKKMSILA